MSEVCSSPFRSSLILNMQKKTVGLFAIASHEGGGIGTRPKAHNIYILQTQTRSKTRPGPFPDASLLKHGGSPCMG
jgi:hypothetical protein